MVALFVILTIVLFILVDFLFTKFKSRQATFFSPKVGFTMADGGTPIESPIKAFLKYWLSVLIFLSPVMLVVNWHMVNIEHQCRFYTIIINLIAVVLVPLTTWYSFHLIKKDK